MLNFSPASLLTSPPPLTNPRAPAHTFRRAELQPKAADPGGTQGLDLLPMSAPTLGAAGCAREEVQPPGRDCCAANAARRGSYIEECRGGQDGGEELPRGGSRAAGSTGGRGQKFSSCFPGKSGGSSQSPARAPGRCNTGLWRRCTFHPLLFISHVHLSGCFVPE